MSRLGRLVVAVVSMAAPAGCGNGTDPTTSLDGGITGNLDGNAGNAGGSGADGAAPRGTGGTGPRGTGGTAGSTGGATSSGLDGGTVCLPPLARCSPGDTCCDEAVCANDATGTPRCRQTCQVRGDCGSLCCLDEPSVGKKLCADESLCPAIECSKVGQSCTGPGEACCAGTVCLAWDNPSRSECRAACTTGTDCSTGCCLPLAGSKSSYCEAAGACQCAPLDAKCGGVTRCCAGTACSSFDQSGAFACKKTCTGSGDCDSKCCRSIQGTGESVCLDASWCQ